MSHGKTNPFSLLNVKEAEDIDFSIQYLQPWSQFYKRSMAERQKSVNNELNNAGSLPLNIADIMIENCIGTLSLPIGISPNFVINNKHYLVPFCVEEASIIAAASSISKLIAKNGGFTTRNSDKNIMIGQIQILNIGPHLIDRSIQIITTNESKYISIGNSKYCASMVKRGGGIIKMECRVINPRIYKHNTSKRDKYLVIHIHIDVCDAMGANICNTICEGLSQFVLNDLISEIESASIGLKILSNLCIQRMTISSFCIPIHNLSWKGVDGMVVANKIISAYEFAIDDIFRAATNNKGIMNGMDAVAVALGQDWRAIECASHCYAYYCSNNNEYGPLAHYFIAYSSNKKCECLYGYLNVPISVGSVGGCINTHPGYKWMLNQFKYDNAKDIANVIVSAGLSTNFAALRALAIQGIQKGHMMLHSKNIAISVLHENQHHLINQISQFMINKKSINRNTAKRYIMARNCQCLSKINVYQTNAKDIVINALDIDLEIKEDIDYEDMIYKLFGKSSKEIAIMYHMMNHLNKSSLLVEIKLLSLLINTALTQYNDTTYIATIYTKIKQYIDNNKQIVLNKSDVFTVLLNAHIYYVKQQPTNIQHFIFKEELLSLDIYLNQQLSLDIYLKSNEFPVKIFLALNIIIKYNEKHLNKEIIQIIQKCAFLFGCNININHNNKYLLYLKLLQINDTKMHKQIFYKRMNEKMVKINDEIKQNLKENKELHKYFDENQLRKCVQFINSNQ